MLATSTKEKVQLDVFRDDSVAVALFLPSIDPDNASKHIIGP